MRIAVAASPEVAIPSLNLLLSSHHTFVCVITQPDRQAGRGQKFRQTPVADWAQSHNISLFKAASKEELAAIVKDIDLVITIGYGVIIPEEILTLPRFGFINLHFSALPRWRGAAPVQRAIEAGDSTIGLTVFQLDKGMDTGPIYLCREFPLSSESSTGQVWKELSEKGAPLVLEALSLIEKGIPPTPQEENGSSRAEKISKEEARISWSEGAEVVLRKIRAFNPNPLAWTTFRGENIKIRVAKIFEESYPPGLIYPFEGQLIVGTGNSSIEIIELIPSGKSSMNGAAWLRGARIVDGEKFGS